MRIAIDRFKGEAPRVSPRLLPNGMAQEATNAKLLSGDLEAWQDRGTIQSLPKGAGDDVVTIFPIDADGDDGGPYWLHWTESEIASWNSSGDVDVVRGLVLGDTDERFYFTGVQGGPYYSNKALATDDPIPDPPDIEFGYPYRYSSLGVGGPASDEVITAEVQGGDPLESNIYLENANAEAGAPDGWTQDNDVLFDVALEGTPAELVAPDGNYVFYGGDATAASEGYQVVTMSEYNILAGGTFTLTWKQASGPDESQAQMWLAFYDATGTHLSSDDVVAPLQSFGTDYTFNDRSLSGSIPSEAKTFRVYMRFERGASGDNDAYIDVINFESQAVNFFDDGTNLDLWTIESSPNGEEMVSSPHFWESSHSEVISDGDIYTISLQENNTQGGIQRNFDLDKSTVTKIKLKWFNGSPSGPGKRTRLHLYLGADRFGTSTVLAIDERSIRVRGSNGWMDRGAVLTDGDLGSPKHKAGTNDVEVTIKPRGNGYMDFDYSIIRVYDGHIWDQGTVTNVPMVGGYLGIFQRIENGSLVGEFAGYPDNSIEDISLIITAAPPGDNATPGSAPDTVLTNYVFTFGKPDGSESQQSLSSNDVRRNDSTGVVVTTPTTSDDADVDRKFIYRAVTGADGTNYYLVPNSATTDGSVPLAQAEFIDTVPDNRLGGVLSTSDFTAPLEDLHGLVAAANGITYGFSGNQVCPSPVNQPYTFPEAYRLATDYKIVAQAVMDTDLIVATQSHTYIVFGSDPAGLSMAKLEKPQGCVSKRSMKTLEGVGVIYASPDGLTSVTRGSIDVVTKGIFTREQWQALVPSSIHAATHDGRYFFWYDTGSVKGGYILDPTPDGFGLVQLDFWCSAAFSNPVDDTLYMAMASGGSTNLVAWDQDSSKLPYVWRSKLYQLPNPTSFAYCQVRADDYTSLRLKLFADESATPFFNQLITSALEFVLPDLEAQQNVEVQVEGISRVRRIELAEDASELL